MKEGRKGEDFKRNGEIRRSIVQDWDIPSRHDTEYSVLRVGAEDETKSDRKRGHMIY